MSTLNTQAAALVVGAGERQGIGGAVAALVAKQGLHLFLAGRTEEKIGRLADLIRAEGGEVTTVVVDSTRADDSIPVCTDSGQRPAVAIYVVQHRAQFARLIDGLDGSHD